MNKQKLEKATRALLNMTRPRTDQTAEPPTRENLERRFKLRLTRSGKARMIETTPLK